MDLFLILLVPVAVALTVLPRALADRRLRRRMNRRLAQYAGPFSRIEQRLMALRAGRLT